MGNIRINYTFDTSTLPGSLKILEENHYYPFGLKHTESYTRKDILFEKKEEDEEWEKKVSAPPPPTFFVSEMVPNSGYQYKYNGKEWQDELGVNVYDYGARNYDPALGRWMNMDALSEKYYPISPYTYALNNPIYFVDPDGNEIIIGNHKDKEARGMYESIVNKALGGNHTVDIDDNGKVTLIPTGNQEKLTAEQSAFYNAFNEVASDTEHTANITLVNNDHDVLFGSFQDGKIDVGDMKVLDDAGNGGSTAAGMMIHETVEQHEKAKNKLSHA